jgi:hypothetical protein
VDIKKRGNFVVQVLSMKRVTALSILVFLSVDSAFSQPLPPPPPNMAIPLDTVVGLLLIFGAGVAVYRLRKKQAATEA